jgi:hypothetical protein
MKPLPLRPSAAGLASSAALLLAAAALAVAAVALASSDSNPVAKSKAQALKSQSLTGAAPTLQSPDGRYRVAATDSGVVLSGPAGTVRVDGSGVSIDASLLAIKGAARVDITGPLVRLNAAGCRPAAHVGDRVSGSATPGGVVASIISGSPTVCIGG